MKDKIVTVSGWLTFSLLALLPVGTVFFACLGYTFSLNNYTVFAAVTAAASAAETVLCTLKKHKPHIIYALSAPLSLINIVFYAFKGCSLPALICLIISFGCVCITTVTNSEPRRLKIICLILTVMMILPATIISLLIFTFGLIGQTTVMKTLHSPDGTYYAAVLNVDQGALGGDTVVNVHKNCDIDLPVLRISKKPKRVYLGEWGEFNDMNIYWKDEHCLVIYSTEYYIE